MFVYNLTIKIDNKLLDEWLPWIINEFVPQVMCTNLFIENNVFELLEPGDDESSTFVLQFKTGLKENYNNYIMKHSKTLNEKASLKWGNHFITFGTLMQSVN